MNETVIDNSSYEYRGLLARSWDFQRGDTSKFTDRQLHREVIESSSEPVEPTVEVDLDVPASIAEVRFDNDEVVALAFLVAPDTAISSAFHLANSRSVKLFFPDLETEGTFDAKVIVDPCQLAHHCPLVRCGVIRTHSHSREL